MGPISLEFSLIMPRLLLSPLMGSFYIFMAAYLTSLRDPWLMTWKNDLEDDPEYDLFLDRMMFNSDLRVSL